ncbi:hypothetical protein PybrP1_009817 [[Pythium] brassicae (nom. inval.)]|nr:hypothetical protein PybrP1_009817 [[Pythium] brassicae (nom. inval.)]
MTAAEKRAARRARVLQGGESRLKLVTGQISTLKEGDAALEHEMDAALRELLGATDGVTADESAAKEEALPTPDTQFAPRPDPAQRRRDAALRRQKKEAVVEQLLAPRQSVTPAAQSATAPQVAAEATVASMSDAAAPATKAATKPAAPVAFSRHALALKLLTFEEKAIALLLIAAALYLAVTTDLGSIATDLDAQNPILVSYQDLLAQGLPLASIRQRMEREQLEAPVMERLERLLSSQFSSARDATATTASSFLPNAWDVQQFFASLVAHPPVILCVLLVRLVVAAVASGVHVAFGLPDVKNPQEDDLGFIVNLVLSSRPALKGHLIKVRKVLDDVFFFLYVLLLAIALRAIWTAHFQ